MNHIRVMRRVPHLRRRSRRRARRRALGHAAGRIVPFHPNIRSRQLLDGDYPVLVGLFAAPDQQADACNDGEDAEGDAHGDAGLCTRRQAG